MARELDYLLARIDGVRNTPTRERGDGWRREDRNDVIVEVAEYLRGALGVPDLEQQLVARSQIDTTALGEAIDWFDALGKEKPSPFAMVFPDGTPFPWVERLEGLRRLRAGLARPHALEELDVGLRLALVGDSTFTILLVALPPDHPVRRRLAERLLAKLQLLTQEQAVAFWARMRMEVDPSVAMHIPIDTSVVAPAFFDFGDADAARSKIADYVTRVRPLLVRAMYTAGQSNVAIPDGGVGIATMLTWTATPATREWSTSDQIAIRSLGRLSLCWGEHKARLAGALRIAENGYLLGGRAEREAKREIGRRDERVPSEDAVYEELTKLVRIAGQKRVAPDAPVERALRAYKLGLEVAAEDIGASFVRGGELRLQRDLLRFLIEREIDAFGTKFGRSETDVRSHDHLGALVVETKVARRLPSESDLNRWLTQLGSYMDESHVALRGALIIYNFTSASILAPTVSIRGRYLILAINLCRVSPSRRRTSIEIEPGVDANIIRVIRVGDPAPSRRPRRRRQR